LDLAKVEAGRTEFRPESVRLPSFIAEVCASLRTLAARKQVQVEIQTVPDLDEVVLDPIRFRQILQNYLANALRFTPTHGHITVRALIEDADLFRLEVEDTGVGIDPSQLSEIFAEFSQLDVIRDREQREVGTGLGLAVTKRLVEAQGGSVGVRSMRGRGSVFHAILPRRVVTTSWPPLPATELEAIGGVLVVIADEALRRRIVAALSDLGHRAILRSNGPSGLEAMKKLDPLAVVMDIVMEGMDAFEFVYRLRGLPAHARTAALVWTEAELSAENRARLERVYVTVMTRGDEGSMLSVLRGVVSSQTNG
jgi:CheY-like chemotaxis protein/anti-sigma regulatory factor (Ser/Thr protein kinase)